MNRKYINPGVIFLACAFVLSFLVSISLPFLTAIDVVRVHIGNNQQKVVFGSTELRLGIWSACSYDTNGHRHGYMVPVGNLITHKTGTISSAWTRGLAVHPVATAVTFAALVLALTAHTLWASLIAFLSALLTLIAFAIDIALFALVDHEMKKVLDGGVNTNTAPAFWMTFVTLILLLLAGCAVFLGHRGDRSSGGSSYPMASIFSRFRK
ncbi:hypothetical protein CPB84DRAFT_1849585 [Gymnopilus junonius]|uniref:Pali-domain-containing protein n=1 Tax=Gymnopilus junonius TaxID=109634 RepID=A0A9P5TJJ5_GYMJU|nr:hypothetical protein CPB84DRAFT_1849585 [Gymnopilus junonius]